MDGLKVIGIHLFLVYADNFDKVGRSVNNINKNT